MSSTGRHPDRITLDAMLLGIALMLSYLEAILPLSLAIPIPGVKLGLANIAVMLAFFKCGIIDAAAISFARVLLCGLLFGSPISTAFAAAGAAAAFVGLLIYKFLLHKMISVVGASLLSAALHAMGQLIAAAILISDTAVFAYAPIMLVSSVVTGAINGILCMLTLGKLKTFPRKNS